jgi:serine protease Do
MPRTVPRSPARARRAAVAALATIGVAALPGAAQAAARPATDLEKVSSVVQPSILQLETVWSGFVRDEHGTDLTPRVVAASPAAKSRDDEFAINSRCTGFVVNPAGYIATAGHCADLRDGTSSFLDAAAAQLWRNEPEKWAAEYPTVEQLQQHARTSWTVRSTGTPRRDRADRDVTATYGVDVGGIAAHRPLPARVLRTREMKNGDVALLKIEADDLPAVELAPAGRARVGTAVVSVGYPGSLDGVVDATSDASFKDGTISSMKPTSAGLRTVLETSAVISRGMSGGPTVDLAGRVVGINSFFTTSEPQTHTFVSPVSEIQQLMRDQGVAGDIGATNRVYRDALRAYFAGDRETAVAGFNQVLELQPGHELAQRLRPLALRLPVPATDDDGTPAALIALIAGGVLILCAGAVAMLRGRGGAPLPGGGAAHSPEPPDNGGGPRRAAPGLVVKDGPLAGRRFPVREQVVLGRLRAGLALDDPQVSRRHAAVRPVERGLEIEDLGSANGTSVNGESLSGCRRLRHSDVVQVGSIRLIADVPAAPREDTALPGARHDALLVVKEGAFLGRRYPIAGDVVIGRLGADITFDDPLVSRRHAIVRPLRDGLELEDLGSVNGTRVNGAQVEGSQRLENGDVLAIGRVVLEVRLGLADHARTRQDPHATVAATSA